MSTIVKKDCTTPPSMVGSTKIYWGEKTKASLNGTTVYIYAGLSYIINKNNITVYPYFMSTGRITENYNSLEIKIGNHTVNRTNEKLTAPRGSCQRLNGETISLGDTIPSNIKISIGFKNIEGVGVYLGQNKNPVAPYCEKNLDLTKESGTLIIKNSLSDSGIYKGKISEKGKIPENSEVLKYFKNKPKGKIISSYNTQKDGKGKNYYPNESYFGTLYAIWSNKKARIRFRINRGFIHNSLGRDVRTIGGRYGNTQIKNTEDLTYIYNQFSGIDENGEVKCTPEELADKAFKACYGKNVKDYICNVNSNGKLQKGVYNTKNDIINAYKRKLKKINGDKFLNEKIKTYAKDKSDNNNFSYCLEAKNNIYYVNRLEWMLDNNSIYYQTWENNVKRTEGLANKATISFDDRLYYDFVGWSLSGGDKIIDSGMEPGYVNSKYTYSPHGNGFSTSWDGYDSKSQLCPLTSLSQLKDTNAKEWLEKSNDIGYFTFFDRWKPKTYYIKYIDSENPTVPLKTSDNQLINADHYQIAKTETGKIKLSDFKRTVTKKEPVKDKKHFAGWKLGTSTPPTELPKNWYTDIDLNNNRCAGTEGWNDDGKGTRDAIKSGGKFYNYKDEDIYLYAVWRNFNITLYNDENRQSIFEQYYDLEYKVKQKLTSKIPTGPNGESFMCWVDKTEEEWVIKLPGEEVEVLRDYHFEPVWFDDNTVWVYKHREFSYSDSIEQKEFSESLGINDNILKQFYLFDFGEYNDLYQIGNSSYYYFNENNIPHQAQEDFNIINPKPEYFNPAYTIENEYRYCEPIFLAYVKEFLRVPMRPGYIFNGWSDGENICYDKYGKITEIGRTKIFEALSNEENIHLYATWNLALPVKTYAYFLDEREEEQKINVSYENNSYPFGEYNGEYVIPQYIRKPENEITYNNLYDNLNNKYSIEYQEYNNLLINNDETITIDGVKYNLYNYNNKLYMIYKDKINYELFKDSDQDGRYKVTLPINYYSWDISMPFVFTNYIDNNNTEAKKNY